MRPRSSPSLQLAGKCVSHPPPTTTPCSVMAWASAAFARQLRTTTTPAQPARRVQETRARAQSGATTAAGATIAARRDDCGGCEHDLAAAATPATMKFPRQKQPLSRRRLLTRKWASYLGCVIRVGWAGWQGERSVATSRWFMYGWHRTCLKSHVTFVHKVRESGLSQNWHSLSNMHRDLHWCTCSLYSTRSIPSCKTFDFFDTKFGYSSYSKICVKYHFFRRGLVY